MDVEFILRNFERGEQECTCWRQPVLQCVREVISCDDEWNKMRSRTLPPDRDTLRTSYAARGPLVFRT